MFLLLAYPIIFLLDYISIASTDSSKDTLDEENKSATDGQEFIQEIINGKKPTVRPESLMFTAPFKICKGECESNVSNFIMIFPIHVGLKRSQTVYKSLYPRDNEDRFSSEDNAPFRKSTTRDPYTLCPTHTTTSGEELRAPTVRPECAHRTIFIMVSSTCFNVQAALPWEQWSWSMPQAPIGHFFRRHENNLMPIKTPRLHCECPPNKECNLEYEINKDIIYFQNLKGIIKDDELMQLKEDFNKKIIRKNNNGGKIMNETLILNRKKRHGDVILDSKELTRDCCCPTRIVKIPAFITNKKFDEVIERLNKKVL